MLYLRSTKLRVELALLAGSWCRWYSSTIHQSFMRCYSSKEVGFGWMLLFRPSSLSNWRSSDPHFKMGCVLVANLCPKCNFSTKHIIFVLVIAHHFGNILVVKVKPCGITSIWDSKIITHSHIQVKWTIVRNDNWIVSLWKSGTPPMYNVSLFNVNFTIHPIHRNFVGVDFFDYSMLLAAIMSLYLVGSDILSIKKLCFVL